MEIKTEELRNLLQKGAVEFEFEKVDGSIREAKGTLNPSLIPEDQLPKTEVEEGEASPYGTNLRYWDLDRNAWRALSANTEAVNLLRS